MRRFSRPSGPSQLSLSTRSSNTTCRRKYVREKYRGAGGHRGHERYIIDGRIHATSRFAIRHNLRRHSGAGHEVFTFAIVTIGVFRTDRSASIDVKN